jgi:hypothetical protein
MVKRLEELVGAVEWLRTNQAKKGAYRGQGELEDLMAALEKLWSGMDELLKGMGDSSGGPSGAAEPLDGEEGELNTLFQQVDKAIQGLIGDRVVVTGEKIRPIQAEIGRMDDAVRKRIHILNRE